MEPQVAVDDHEIPGLGSLPFVGHERSLDGREKPPVDHHARDRGADLVQRKGPFEPLGQPARDVVERHAGVLFGQDSRQRAAETTSERHVVLDEMIATPGIVHAGHHVPHVEPRERLEHHAGDAKRAAFGEQA